MLDRVFHLVRGMIYFFLLNTFSVYVWISCSKDYRRSVSHGGKAREDFPDHSDSRMEKSVDILHSPGLYHGN